MGTEGFVLIFDPVANAPHGSVPRKKMNEIDRNGVFFGLSRQECDARRPEMKDSLKQAFVYGDEAILPILRIADKHQARRRRESISIACCRSVAIASPSDKAVDRSQNLRCMGFTR
jgi:hypothetical protein